MHAEAVLFCSEHHGCSDNTNDPRRTWGAGMMTIKANRGRHRAGEDGRDEGAGEAG